MRTMYLIGGIALLVAGLIYFLASESLGWTLMTAVLLGFVFDFAYWATRSRDSGHPAAEEPATSEPHRPPDRIDR